MTGSPGYSSAPLPGHPRNLMKTARPPSSLEQSTTLFERAARMDVAAQVGPPPPATVVNKETFAALRQEAEISTRPAAPPGRGQTWSNPRLTFGMDTVRAAVFRQTWQRKLEADEVFRPEF